MVIRAVKPTLSADQVTVDGTVVVVGAGTVERDSTRSMVVAVVAGLAAGDVVVGADGRGVVLAGAGAVVAVA